MSRSASKIKDVKSSAQKEFASFKSRRSVSVDTRARGSYVPEKRRPSSEERKSGNKLQIRWSSTRKSSINLAESKRKDMRQLTDKVYQKKKVSEIVEFLNETGFSPPIAVSKLMAPSKKDFENVFQFLYRFFDPTYEVKKIEEEGPKILKNLLYPFTINKSAFVYVARTNWPSLLGALIWLMDLNKFAMKVDLDKLMATTEDDENEIQKIVLCYICQCYHARIDNEEEEIDVYTKIVKDKVNLDKVIAENEEKKQLASSLEKEINERKTLADQIVTLNKNIEKYEEFILKMKSHYRSRSESYEKLMNELKLKESELKILQEQVSQKQDAYDAQGFDGKKHQNFFEMQKREIAEKLEKKRALVKEMQDKHWEAEIKYTKIYEKVAAAAENSRALYNSTIESLKNALVPLLNIKIPQVQNLYDNFQVNFAASDIPSDGCSVESKKAWRESCKSLTARIIDSDEILKKICVSQNKKLSVVEMKSSDMSLKLKVQCLENNKEEDDLNSKKKTNGDGICTFETQCDKLREITHCLQAEKLQLEKTYSEMNEEKRILQKFFEKKEKQLKDYLIEQKDMFCYFSRSEEQAQQECEMYGNEIAQEFEDLNCL